MLMDKIIEKLLEKLTPIIAEQMAKLVPIIVDKLTAIIPVIVAAVVKAITDQLKAAIPGVNLPVPDPKVVIDKVIEADPDLPGLSNIFDLSEWLKGHH